MLGLDARSLECITPPKVHSGSGQDETRQTFFFDFNAKPAQRARRLLLRMVLSKSVMFYFGTGFSIDSMTLCLVFPALFVLSHL